MAVGVVVGGCVLMPVIMAFWWGLVWIRVKISEKISK